MYGIADELFKEVNRRSLMGAKERVCPGEEFL